MSNKKRLGINCKEKRLKSNRFAALLRSNTAIVIAVGLLLITVYHLNFDYLPGNDATPNIYLALSLLREGNLSLDYKEFPSMFHWEIWTGKKWVRERIFCWDEKIYGVPVVDLYQRGLLRPRRESYFILESVHPNLYVGNYGLGPPLSLVPFFATFKLFIDDLESRTFFLWYSSKTIASLFVAASAVFVLLTAMRFVSRKASIIIALAYGLGTCVWTMSSQTFMQHAPTEFFVALGIYFLVRIQDRRIFASLCGLAFGAAVLCRPTCAVFVIAIGIYLMIVDRKSAIFFFVGGFPMAIVLGIYNSYYFGMPWSFGQTESAKLDATFKIGPEVESVWCTPLHVGLAGHLFSPSRGLFIYSPFIIFSIWGVWKAWREKKYLPLRPLFFGAMGIILIQAKWFDWWSGWSYGYRHIVDTMPIFAIYLIPVIDVAFKNKFWTSVFYAFLGWSIFAQVVGAFAYDVSGWNAKMLYKVQISQNTSPVFLDKPWEVADLVKTKGAKILNQKRMNIDRPKYRYRLWSLRDNMIFWYALHFNNSRTIKKQWIQNWSSQFRCNPPD